MAPIFATSTGMTLHPLSAPLQQLMMNLKSVTAETVQSVLAAADDSCFSEEQVRHFCLGRVEFCNAVVNRAYLEL
jgi:hypothetical protein